MSSENVMDVSTLASTPYMVRIETTQGNLIKYLIKKQEKCILIL